MGLPLGSLALILLGSVRIHFPARGTVFRAQQKCVLRVLLAAKLLK